MFIDGLNNQNADGVSFRAKRRRRIPLDTLWTFYPPKSIGFTRYAVGVQWELLDQNTVGICEHLPDQSAFVVRGFGFEFAIARLPDNTKRAFSCDGEW